MKRNMGALFPLELGMMTSFLNFAVAGVQLRNNLRAFLCFVLVSGFCGVVWADTSDIDDHAKGIHKTAELGAPLTKQRFAEITQASESQPGFVPLYWHSGEGRLYGEITQLDAPLIYYPSLSQGVGSNDLGLDRGRLGRTQLVQFERVGPRLLLVALNTKYRASSENPDERRAVEEAFARSVLWGFDIAAEDSGRLLIDMTDFAQRDALGLSALLADRGEGSYAIDPQRSVINLRRSKAFPDNTEVDALVTFIGNPVGDILPLCHRMQGP